MRRPLRVALAGAGMVSAHHLIAWRKCAHAEVVAIADPERAPARRRAEEFGIPAVYGSTAEMLDVERPDAIDIAVPMEHHHEIAVEAARRRVSVLLQKPIAPSLAEAALVVGEVTSSVRMMVHENWRFRPYYRQAKAWLDSGRIGQPMAFRFDVESSGLFGAADGGDRPALVRQPFLATLDRLIVLELMIHHLDTLRFLLGELTVEAAATARISRDVRGEDTASIMLRSDRGASGVLFGSMALAGRGPSPADRLVIAGRDGSIEFDRYVLTLATVQGAVERIVFDPEASYQSAYDAAVAHFADCLASGAPFETDGEDNLRSLALVEAVYAASREPS